MQPRDKFQSLFENLEKVFEILGIDYYIMENWSCCGATSVKSLYQDLNLALNLRNLSVAEEQGIDELIEPCASCYQRSATTEYDLLQDKDTLDKLTKDTGYKYEGKVKVRNILDFFVNIVGLDRIAEKVTHPLSEMVIACYYECLNTRVPREHSFDVTEYPMSMDKLMKTLGAKTIDWSYKTECCGASLFLTKGSIWEKLVGKILKDANLRDADCVAVSCPMCQTNLDTKQEHVREKYHIEESVPVPFISQLMGLAFGCRPEELGLNMNFEPMKSLE